MLIGVIASIGIIGLVISLLVGLKEMSDNRKSNQQIAGLVAILQGQQLQAARDLRCTEQWSNKLNQRDRYIAKYTQIRVKASTDLQQAKLHNRPPSVVFPLRRKLVQANRAYLRATKNHPVPVYRCADLPPLDIPGVHLPEIPPVRPTHGPPRRSGGNEGPSSSSPTPSGSPGKPTGGVTGTPPSTVTSTRTVTRTATATTTAPIITVPSLPCVLEICLDR